MKFFMRGISIILTLIIAIGFYQFATMPSNSDINGNNALAMAQHSLNSLGNDMGATSWDFGKPKNVSTQHWIYSGAYFELPACIPYGEFEEKLIKNNFRKMSTMGAFYCQHDIDIFNIESESEKIVDNGISRELYMCEKIYFWVTWKEGQNAANENCFVK